MDQYSVTYTGRDDIFLIFRTNSSNDTVEVCATTSTRQDAIELAARRNLAAGTDYIQHLLGGDITDDDTLLRCMAVLDHLIQVTHYDLNGYMVTRRREQATA